MFIAAASHILAFNLQEAEPFNLEGYGAIPTKMWVAQEQTQVEIKRRFVSSAAVVQKPFLRLRTPPFLVTR